MHEMRAESVPGRSETLWHVLARGQSVTSLCGYRPAAERMVTALMAKGAVERYCDRCMTAFRAAMEDRAPHADEPPRDSAAA
ncbi:hypothetical protein ACFWCB_34860 [Streptomyces sp. NPDC060048]|uniref:hypothetical protein n=1 Tax=unclassified Streptomyces TaxID=2593676 RepID=UPI0036D19D11